MSISETSICNMALGRIGCERIVNYEDTGEASAQAIQCRLHYEQTRDKLFHQHAWRFAKHRVALSVSDDSPAFEWDYQYLLPEDMVRALYLSETSSSYSIEGSFLLTNDDEAKLVYIRKIEDPTKFTPLFVEVLVLELALKFVMPLTKDNTTYQILQNEIQEIKSSAMMINATECNKVGEYMQNTNRQADEYTWNNARITGV